VDFARQTSEWVVQDALPINRRTVTAFWDEGSQSAFIFGNNGLQGPTLAVNYDPSSELITFNPDFPRYEGNLRAAVQEDGRYAFLVGGHSFDLLSPEWILRFDPSRGTHEEIRVINLLGPDGDKGGDFLQAQPLVYVEKLNRLYLFGGYVQNYGSSQNSPGHRAEIGYINLSPLNP